MGDRDDKLTKAREKLEKFRKKKQKLQDPSKSTVDILSSESSASSPLMFQSPTNLIPASQITATEAVSCISAVASPPAPSLASYFGSAVTEFEIIPQLSIPNSLAVEQETEAVPTNEEGQEDQCPSNQDHGFNLLASVGDPQNLTEETSPAVQVETNQPLPDVQAQAKPIETPDDVHTGTEVSANLDSLSTTESLQQHSSETTALLTEETPPAVKAETNQPLPDVQTQPIDPPDDVLTGTEVAANLNSLSTREFLQQFSSETTALLKEETSPAVQVEPNQSLPDVQSKPIDPPDDELTGTKVAANLDTLSTTESLQQLSSETKALLTEHSNFSHTSSLLSQLDQTSQVLDLEQRNQELVKLLDDERKENENSSEDLVLINKQVKEMQERSIEQKMTFESALYEENLKLKADMEAQAKTIELIVGQKTELEACNCQLKAQNESFIQQKTTLETSVEQLGSECAELRAQVKVDGSNSEMFENLRVQTGKEMKILSSSLKEKEESYLELQSKLGKVATECGTAKTQLAQVSSELEMCKVLLAQLRGSGAQDICNEKDAEIAALNCELGVTRKNLSESMGRVEHLAGERDQLADQYRNYSRDLASQAERLAEQLRKFQDENGRLVHREAGLVQNVASLESQLQKLLKEGKNVTEEEICRLKDQVLTCETDMRMTRDEKHKLQQMLSERGNQVDEMVQRLSIRANKIMELQAMVSGLETTVEMMKATAHTGDTDQAQFLAACQSDKVAASRAMQQNVSLKERLEELQGALVTITNSKAELLDQLENANRKINTLSIVEAEITARNEAVKEKEMMLTNLKKQVRYLEEELSRRKTSDQHENISTDNIEPEQPADVENELIQAKDTIRSLNSQNSELRSRLEVLASTTRDCSESRCTSSFDEREEVVDSSRSESSESFVEINDENKSSVASSDSFINIEPSQLDDKTDDDNLTDVTTVEQTVIRTADLPFIPLQGLENPQIHSSLDNIESVRQLEGRFMAAMEQLAELSSDKEQLEHLVERLEVETETIGDYVIMYQHQRKMQKLKIQEKEEQVQQLAKDRAELLTKLSKLQQLVTNMVENPSDKISDNIEVALENKKDEIEKVSDMMASSMEKEKILELINEIGTGSNQMMARCENFEPWFWENSPSKVLTV